MANGKNAQKQNKDWWGKRPLAHHSVSNNSKVNKWWKRLLHKIERKMGEKQIRNEL